MRNSYTAELQIEERRLVDKLSKRARKVMSEDRSLSFQQAMVRACQDFPRCYAGYSNVRAELARLGVMPLPIDGLGLSKTPTRG